MNLFENLPDPKYTLPNLTEETPEVPFDPDQNWWNALHLKGHFPLSTIIVIYVFTIGWRNGDEGMDVEEKRREDKGREGKAKQVKRIGFG